MKRTIGTYFSAYFKMPHLYRDDLEAIEKVICQDLRPEKYFLACGGFEYDRLASIPAEMAAANVLVLYTHSPCLRLKFARSWAELYCGEDGSGVNEAARRIALIITKCERPWLWGFCKFSAWLAPLMGFGSLAIVLGLITLEVLTVRALYLVSWLLLLASIWWAVGHRCSLNNFSRVDLQQTRGRTRAWTRHREKIVIFLAGLGLGAVSAWLLAKYFSLI